MYLLSSKLFSFEDIFQHNAKFYLKYLIPHSSTLGYTLISLSFMFAKRFTWMTLHMSWAVFGTECENDVCWLLILQQSLLAAPLTLLAISFRGQHCVTWALEGVGWVTAGCHSQNMHALLTLHGSVVPQRSCFSSMQCLSLVEICSLELQGS